MQDSDSAVRPGMSRLKRTGLFLSFPAFVLILLLPPPDGLELSAWRTAGVGIFMAILWITEAVPIPVTALLPLVLFPLLGISDIKAAAAPYSNPIIFLFMGGFIIALGMERWNLHRRLALNIIHVIGTKPKSIIAGFMIAAAFLSMWVSNTATTMMMLPIGLSVVELAEASSGSERNAAGLSAFGTALLLSIAYASSIGGLGTLIGTPPNALLAAFLSENYNYHIGFVRWMSVGIPLVLVGIPLTFLLLTSVLFPIKLKTLPGGREFISAELAQMGDITRPEKMVAAVFAGVALLWITRPLTARWVHGLSDAGIAILGAVLMFFLPVNFKKGLFLLDWRHTRRLPWGILLLFGGGLSLATAISRTGLSTWIGHKLGLLSHWPVLFIVVIATAIVILLTELTSNTATTAAFLPIMASVALGIGQNPLLLVIPTTLAATCAFMLPVATPPNAIVFGSGQITIPQMARAGILLNLMFIALISLMSFTLVAFVFHIRIGVLPLWAPMP